MSKIHNKKGIAQDALTLKAFDSQGDWRYGLKDMAGYLLTCSYHLYLVTSGCAFWKI